MPMSAERPPLLSWVRTHPYTVAAAVFFVGMGIPFLTRQNSEWDDVYVRAARHLLAGESIYQPNEGYVYPPFMAAVAVPFALLPPVGDRLAWYLVNVGCALALCSWAWSLAGGGRLEGGGAGRREHCIGLLGLAAGGRYVIDAFSHQQTDLLTGALVLGGCWALSKRRPLLSASLAALAAAVKCSPLLWCGYLAWKREWRAVLWLVLLVVGLSLLPDLIHSPTDGRSWAEHWARTYLSPMTHADRSPGAWFTEPVYNQSLAGALYRWGTTYWAWGPAGFGVADRTMPLGAGVQKVLLLGVELIILGIGIAALAAARSRSHATRAESPGAEAVEFAIVLLLMLLLSPVSSKPHFCTFLLPGFCLARRAMVGRNPASAAFLVGAIASGVAGVKGVVGADLASVALWYGNVTGSALLLLSGCIWAVVQRPPVPSERPQSQPASYAA